MHSRLLLALAALALVACGSSAGSGPASTCPTLSGPGTTHAGETISADVTWTAAGSPHVITYTPTVVAGATLRLEPCAEVRIEAGHGLLVAGRLEAIGSPEQPITLAALDPARPFGFIEVRAGFADLAYVHLANGGAVGPNSNAMLDVWGASTPQRTENARLRHVTLTGSEQYGLTLERSGTLTADSTDVVVQGAKLAPVMVRGAELVGGVPVGSYTGNGLDELVVIARDPMLEDTTWPARGVPYRLGDADKDGNDLRIGSSAAAGLVTWTLEPGVTVRVADGGRILVQRSGSASAGSIIAIGAAAAPIVFTSTSAAPAPGRWRGIAFEATNAPSTALDYVELRDAGGPSYANSFHCEPGSAGAYSVDEDAALALYGEPTGAFLTRSLIADSAGDAVDLAYSGSSVSFLEGNTFAGIARCRQTLPRSTDGTCPNPVPVCE